jgi:hypothetical protein
VPEQLTKHPDVTLQVLRSAGAQCGEGAPQSILVKCPAQRFCKVPGGELCVYGLGEAPQMTQITTADWQSVQQAVQGGEPSKGILHAGDAALTGAAGIVVGAALAVVVLRWRKRRP